MGIVVKESDGMPVAGATVESTQATSGAVIRYLNEDMTAFQETTSATGMFVMLNPGIGEKFDAVKDGFVLSRDDPGTFGNAKCSVLGVAIWERDVNVKTGMGVPGMDMDGGVDSGM